MKVMHEDDAREKTLIDSDEIRPEKAMKNTLIQALLELIRDYSTNPDDG